MDPPHNESATVNPSPAAFEGNDATADSQIWTAEEKRILKSHIAGYRSAPRKTKSCYVAQKVIPEIKNSWLGRYNKKKLKKEPMVKKEWDKKKDVCMPNPYNLVANENNEEDIYVVWEQCGLRPQSQNSRVQFQCNVQYSGSG